MIPQFSSPPIASSRCRIPGIAEAAGRLIGRRETEPNSATGSFKETNQCLPTTPPRRKEREESHLGALRVFAVKEPGYDLAAIRDVVLAVKQNFPNGIPALGDARLVAKLWFCILTRNATRRPGSAQTTTGKEACEY